MKGARVSDYGGKSLNAGDEHSQIFVDPPGDKRCDDLRKWYASANPDQIKNASSVTAVRESTDASNPQVQRSDNFKLIQEVIECVTEDMASLNNQPMSYGGF